MSVLHRTSIFLFFLFFLKLDAQKDSIQVNISESVKGVIIANDHLLDTSNACNKAKLYEFDIMIVTKMFMNMEDSLDLLDTMVLEHWLDKKHTAVMTKIRRGLFKSSSVLGLLANRITIEDYQDSLDIILDLDDSLRYCFPLYVSNNNKGPVKPVRTGRRMAIAGYECAEHLVLSDTSKAYMWIPLEPIWWNDTPAEDMIEKMSSGKSWNWFAGVPFQVSIWKKDNFLFEMSVVNVSFNHSKKISLSDFKLK